MTFFPVVIIGGGPSGLFCALNAGVCQAGILLLEKKQLCGRKLIISGTGQCNITHEGDIRSFLQHYGDNGKFLKPALMNFKNSDLIAFFESNGVCFETEPGGKVFPKTRKATDILNVLLSLCQERGVIIRKDNSVRSVLMDGDVFRIDTHSGMVSTGILVIATGGETYPATGSTGDGYQFARALGHNVSETGPALTCVHVEKYPFRDLSGISFTDLSITLFREGKKIKDNTGDFLLTHTGLSGPGILDLSRYIRPGDLLKVSFISGEKAEIQDRLINEAGVSGSRRVKTILSEAGLPERLIKRIMEISNLDLELTTAHLSKKDRQTLVETITAFPFRVNNLGGRHEAMVTRGGVVLEEVNPKTMESKLVPGLFIIGEVLDIDGDTGGYNLQAAFSTAKLAGDTIKKRLSQGIE